jgi:hypothetical protein
VQAKAALTTQENYEKFSNAGNTTPAGAERGEEPYTVTEIPLESTVNFNLSTPFQERVKVVQLESAASIEQMNRIGQVRGAELIGRARGCEFQVPLTDDLLQMEDPLPTWRFILPTGEQHIVQVNGLQFSHNPDKAICAGVGIRLLTIPAPTIAVPAPIPAPPYPVLDIQTPVMGDNGNTVEPVLSIPEPPIVSRAFGVGAGGGVSFDYEFVLPTPAELIEVGGGSGVTFDTAPLYTVQPATTTIIGAGAGVLNADAPVALSFLAERGGGSGVWFASTPVQSTDTYIGLGGGVYFSPTETHLIGVGGGVEFADQSVAELIIGAGGGVESSEQTISQTIVGAGSWVLVDSSITPTLTVVGAGGATIFS